MAGTQPGRPRHRAARAVRDRGRPPHLSAGRGRQRGLSRHGPTARVGEAARPARRLPDARRAQRLDLGPPRGHRPAPHHPRSHPAGHADLGATALRPRAGHRPDPATGQAARHGDQPAVGVPARGALPDLRRLRHGPRPAAQSASSRRPPTRASTSACNAIRIHTWGNERCCLPRGTTSAHLFSVTGSPSQRRADPPAAEGGRPAASRGGARSGHRRRGRCRSRPPAGRADRPGVARSADSTRSRSPTSSTTGCTWPRSTSSDSLVKVTAPVPIASTLPLLEVTWRPVDALAFPLCLSSVLDDGTAVDVVALARGNIGGRRSRPAHHGRRPVRATRSPAIGLACA